MTKNLLPSIGLLLLVVCFFFSSCEKKVETLFRQVPASETGIFFNNRIESTDSFNILTYEYIYNGGGVATADFNNDGLTDVFFVGNQVKNRMYLNQGNFKFSDITDVANVNVDGRWSSGVAVVDINNDGFMDMYVCATTYPDSTLRKNMLFVNQGVDEDGKPRFKELASDYKIDFDGHSMMAAFFDFDRDDDLDLYVLVNVREGDIPTNYRVKIKDGSARNNDHLFRNEGNGTFKDVSLEAGIVEEGFGLGLAISDFNGDGWPDIYVSNDYLTNDILYLNNRDGSFQNKTREQLGHQSQFSMGNDVADINNDGLPDIITLDMLPETSERKKTTIGNKSYQTYINNEKFGYEYQYVRNMLQLNNGSGSGVKFSEIGMLAGVHQTEWSWSPLFADFDNDGDKDLLITNGFPKDITDKDFANFRSDVEHVASNQYLVDSIPVIKISNYAFQNNNNLTFTDVSQAWGVGIPSFSNGAAFCDLDNDGDLDYLVNNIDDEAFVFENTLYAGARNADALAANYLRIKISPKGLHNMALGSKVSLFTPGGMQWAEKAIYRGYLSSVEETMHFGLGKEKRIDSIIVTWPDGTRDKMENVSINTTVTFTYPGGRSKELKKPTRPRPILEQVSLAKTGLAFVHQEEDKIDYNHQRTLPHKFSQSGPALGVGDVNGDGLEDFYVGGSSSYPGTLFIQNKTGFARKDFNKSVANAEEDEGVLFFDADNDGDLDLYLVSGGMEVKAGSPEYQDRLYVNDGSGNLKLAPESLPEIFSSGSCVRAADFDQDGDLDLFVGGRVVPGAYPMPAQSYLLRNDQGKFTDATTVSGPALANAGMIADALWTDFDNDGKIDLILAAEFSPLQLYKNVSGKLERVAPSGLDNFSGWWNSLSGADFDSDGDTDYIAGNLGLNNPFNVSAKYPLTVFAKDFDNNGSVDPILACYSKLNFKSDSLELCPIHFWEELNSQSPKFRQQFSYYKQYGRSTLHALLSDKDLQGATVMKANFMATSYIENLGNSEFKVSPLPVAAQVAPVNGMVCEDFTADGNVDILMVGNDFGNEVFTGRYDAFTGLLLRGDGHGKFAAHGSADSGFRVQGDAKALAKLSSPAGDLIVATQNRDSLKAYRMPRGEKRFILSPEDQDSWAEVVYPGKKQKLEFYYGSGYLSQSTRKVAIPQGALHIIVYDFKGQSRKIEIK